MNKNLNWSLIIIFVGLVLWGVYAFLFGWLVPKTAFLTIPRKWQMIPLRQTKEIVHDYLGEPGAEKNPHNSTGEEWANGNKRKMYFLRIYYVSDTMAVSYSIHYQYKNWLVSRRYLIDSASIR